MISGLINKLLKESFESTFNFSKIINYYLYNKYSKFECSFQHMIIDNLICNDNCHIVSRFKDFLIYDDDSEFLIDFYKKDKLKLKLKETFKFYSTYICVYPNYLVIPEKKYIYKNLRKKQKVINEKNEKKKNKIKEKSDKTNEISIINNNDINDDLNQTILIKNKSINKNIYNSEKNEKEYIHSKSSICIKKNNNNNQLFNPKENYTDRNYLKINLKTHLKRIKSYNNNQKNQYSSISISYMNYYDESKKSNASLTEIINLLNTSHKSHINNNKNNNRKKTKNKLVKADYKLTKNNKERIKFFRLGDTDYIIKKIVKIKKIKPNSIKTGIEKISSIKKEIKNINKKNYLQNYKQKTNIKIVDKVNILHKQTLTCPEDISKIIKNNPKNNREKKPNSLLISQKNNNDRKKINDHYQNFVLKTISNFMKKNNLNNLKNNIRNNIIKIFNKKKVVSKNLRLSINETINFENKNSNINKKPEYFTKKTDFQTFNTSKNIIKKNNNIMKTIENKPITKLKHSKFNRSKIESDSLLSTQVTINKKLRHNSTLTEHIISKMKKNSIIKSNNAYKYNNKNTLSFSNQYENYYKINHFEYKEKLLDKINSYGIKSFTNHYKKISYFTNNNDKISEKKPFLIKNKKIFSFFESKEFHNLRISSNNKRKLKNYQTKKYNLKDNDKINKSISILLKSFNKESINNDINNKTNINNQNNNFAQFKKDNHFKTQVKYKKNENKIVSNKTHKKNNTTNVGKIIEEFEKRIKKANKINKDIENNRNSKSVLNRPKKNKNNRNFIKYKISSKTLTKSLKIKNDNKLNKN